MLLKEKFKKKKMEKVVIIQVLQKTAGGTCLPWQDLGQEFE